ncbi:methyltransferase [Candidatus Woesearchaeota archaeon]|nr:methyltransferase [Candidatus Woesearchaeota archaeon]
MFSKKQLAVTLSRLQSFEKPSVRLEQYPTDSEIAAEIIWFAYQNGDVEKKTIADLGCGTGILGIGTMFFSPKKVYFLDIDEIPLKRLKENLQLQGMKKGSEIICDDVTNFSEKVDIVFQNPPFGVKNAHADKVFLEQAFKVADTIYSFHKTTSKPFIEKISKDNGFKVTHFFTFNFPLKQTQHFHTRKIHRVDVGCWRLQKL